MPPLDRPFESMKRQKVESPTLIGPNPSQLDDDDFVDFCFWFSQLDDLNAPVLHNKFTTVEDGQEEFECDEMSPSPNKYDVEFANYWLSKDLKDDSSIDDTLLRNDSSAVGDEQKDFSSDQSKAFCRGTLYRMAHNLTTVQQVWNEYKYGLDGNPSVASLDAFYGYAWRGIDTFYHYRRRVYKAILSKMNQGETEEDAVKSLEDTRTSNGWSLHKLQSRIDIDGNLIHHIYEMSRNISTAGQAWEEYSRGLEGGPSVKQLDQKYGKSWRDVPSQQELYNERRKIYCTVKKLVAAGVTEKNATLALDAWRQSNNWTLSELQNNMHHIIINSNDGIYKLARNLETVKQVWDEYSHGLGGNPSIKSLNFNYGHKWLNSSSEIKFYSDRNKVYKAVQNLLSNGETEQEAVSSLDKLIKDQNLTLYQFQKRLNSDGILRNESTISNFKQNRGLETVEQAWEEYTKGIDGKPSVKSMDDEFKSKWRTLSADRKFYYGRKMIYDRITNMVNSGMTESDAVTKLDEFRILKGWSLNQLQNGLIVDKT